jgi:hypothetical protein
VEEHVHLSDGQSDAVHLLPVKSWGLALLLGVSLLKQEPPLDEQLRRAAGGVIDRALGFGVGQVAMSQPTSFGV